MTEILCYEGLRKTVRGSLLLDIESLAIHAHHCVVLSGKNGAGKSTLLRIIAGLEKPDTARVRLGGQALSWRQTRSKMRTQIIYLHQQPYLFDHSVAENIAYGLRRRGLSLKEISSKVSEALDWAGIGHLQLRNARELSGGERQRVAFARARILSPGILLLDEPTSNMDNESRAQAYRMIKWLKEEGVSIMVASHEIHTIAHLCEDHLLLQGGRLQSQPLRPEDSEGKIIPYG